MRVFRVQSLVWAAVILGRGAFRLTLLLTGADIGDYVALSFLTGAPVTFATLAWSIRHAIANPPEPDSDETTTDAG